MVTGPSIATGRRYLAGAGTNTSGLVFGGGPSVTQATEEFTGETTAANVKTITTS